MSPKLLGLIRYVGAAALWGALHAVFTYLGDAAHLTGIVSPIMTTIVVGIAGLLDHSIEAKGNGALFGSVRIRRY